MAMFESLRKIFKQNQTPPGKTEAAPGFSPEKDERSEKEKRGSEGTPGGKDEAGGQRLPAFVCHEALLGRAQRIVGYEFGHPQRLQSRMLEKRALIRRFYDDALLRHLAGLELDSLLGARMAFIEISPDSLAHPALARLPKRNLVLALAFPETPEQNASGATSGVVAALAALRAQGVRIGLKWQKEWRRRCPELPEFLPHADFVQISWREYAGDAAGGVLAGEIAQFRRGAAAADGAPLRLIAGALQTPDDFSAGYRLGFDLFRGPFINDRDQWTPPKSSVNRLRVVQLLNGVRRDADTAFLAQELKQDPVLSYKLLRYINSPALGLQRQITTLDQALVILGRENLYRWLSLLLFNMADPGYREWALTEQALARAALMERLGRALARDGRPASAPPSSDALFLTGLFSLLDQLLGEPLVELTAKIQLPPEIRAALVERRGAPAAFLALAEACETENPEAIAACATALGFSATAVNRAVFDALAWAQEMMEVSTS